jgi:lysine 6-dehydrogenase
MRIVVLGCGFHGRGIAYEIAAAADVKTLIAADIDGARAAAVAAKAGCEAATVDIFDTDVLGRVLDGATLVFNAVGPYHRTAATVIEAALAAGVHYADMADDHEAAEMVFLNPTWDARAREAGISILVGCGIAPGLTGLLARLGCERLEVAERVAVRFSWNYSITYPAAIHHFLRINSGLAPQFIDGAHQRPGAFAGRETVTFLPPVGPRTVYCTGINDPVSIPHSIPGLREVTAKGAFHQPDANAFLEAMVHWGMTSYGEVPGTGQSPFDFLIAYLNSDEGQRRFDIPQEPIPMAIRVEVSGQRGGRAETLVFEGQDSSRRGTTAPSALAALMVARRELDFTGARAPEGCIDPGPFLRRLLDTSDLRLFEFDEAGDPRPLAV